jgi:hypothetical protein
VHGKAGGHMNFGFNSNVRVGDVTYHVQTEDRGPSHPFMDTVVYLSGRVLHKRSVNYQQFAGEDGMDAETLARKLHQRLAQQHREVIADLEAGTLPIPKKKVTLPAEQNVATDELLDLRLKNPKNWFAAGTVTLEIELCERNSKHRIGDAAVQACLEYEKHRTPCAEARTDSNGCATLKFSMPPNVEDGSFLFVRATDGYSFGELRFRLKSKSREVTPTPVEP